MNKQGNAGLQYVRRIIDNDRYALIAVIAFILIPYMSWVAMTILSLVTLRKGARQASLLVIPAITAHTLIALTSMAWTVASIDAIIQVVPCFIASCVLRMTNSWKAVACAFFCLLMLAAMAIHLFLPQLIEAQWMYLEAMLRSVDSGQVLLQAWQAKNIPTFIAANYLFGFQAVCLVFALVTPIWFARSLQARLFYPGGFRQEMLNFRGDKYSLLTLFVLGFAAVSHQTLAMNALPMMITYFVLAGLSLGSYVFAKMTPIKVMFLLVLPVMLMPMVMVPVYVLFGCLDSLVNCRLFLATRARNTM